MVHTTALGGTASGIQVANVGHGLMHMTLLPTPIPDEQAFEAIKSGVDAAAGAKVLLNSGEFYGNGLSPANLELLARFYERFPEYADKTVLCVKGGMLDRTLTISASEENIRRSIDNINAKLRGTKRVDIFENARVDPSKPIEETITIMKKLILEGKFNHIGMSECSAETLRRANSIHPIASVEIEVSPWSYEPEAKKVISAAAELKIPILAYSPLGRGFLTGSIRSPDDLDAGDYRRNLDRFKPENFKHNLDLADSFNVAAKKKGITPGQLCIAWVLSLGDHMVPIPGSSIPSSLLKPVPEHCLREICRKATRTLENLSASDITLSSEERREINEIIELTEVKGSRYFAGVQNLWG